MTLASCTDEQRRILLNLWVRVARADGVVVSEEIDRLSQLFYRLGDDLLNADEVVRWLDEGPPEIGELLPSALAPLFLEHAREIMLADHQVDPSESDAVRELLATYFRAG
ncbi:MAG TPA: hypothetical protein VFX59_03835 [Polyangiales bacterium]|nr:hypothetical protein [Polyangiales bacterium]